MAPKMKCFKRSSLRRRGSCDWLPTGWVAILLGRRGIPLYLLDDFWEIQNISWHIIHLSISIYTVKSAISAMKINDILELPVRIADPDFLIINITIFRSITSTVTNLAE